MTILLSNDDGIDSPGLRLLQKALEIDHEVWVVAPDSNRSGFSHSITLGNPTKFKQLGQREYASGGTPADCVLHACLGLVPVGIDMVVAGINLGPNLGTDIVYSGTAAAARQGAFMRKPAVACSLSTYNPPYHLEFAVEFMVKNLMRIRDLWSEDHFLNINFPNQEKPAEPVITIPTRRIYEDELVRFTSPQGDLYSFIGGQIPGGMMEEGSDFGAVEAGFTSLSPVLIHPTNHEVEERYREASFFWKSG
ncbi:MAG: 5'/3'-nucleotidase SurE [Spirochaetaceae bacterium]|nr:MAG: 5'/3'-nucleotidase SurE [Spirochaetaceae bacterium]